MSEFVLGAELVSRRGGRLRRRHWIMRACLAAVDRSTRPSFIQGRLLLGVFGRCKSVTLHAALQPASECSALGSAVVKIMAIALYTKCVPGARTAELSKQRLSTLTLPDSVDDARRSVGRVRNRDKSHANDERNFDACFLVCIT